MVELGLCIEMALTGLPFRDRFQAAADVGFTNVEMWFVKGGSYDGSPAELARLADAANVTITNTVIGAPDGSVGGGLTDPAKREAWLERTRMTLAVNREAGIPATIVCTGNRVDGMTDKGMAASVLEGLKPTVEMAEQAGVTLLLEPLNTTCDHPGYFLASSDRGADICRALKSDRMRLLFDCYHMQIMEGDLVRHIERNMDVIGHLHGAGVPGRHELYHGETNYPFLLKQIEAFHYKGVFGLEYEPSVADVESLRATLEHLD